MCLACSVAELVSAYPTCGGLYYTISRTTPKNWVPSISWVTGWINLLGQVAGIASSEYGSAQLLLAAVSMGSDFTYQPTNGQTVGVMAALTVFCGLVNSLSTYWMEKMTKTYVIFHILILVSGCIALLATTFPKNSANYVFTDVTSSSGWEPVGFSFLFGFLSVSWTMTDYDATAHITEECVYQGYQFSCVESANLLIGSASLRSRPLGPSQWLCCSHILPAGCSTLFSASAWATLKPRMGSWHLQQPSP